MLIRQANVFKSKVAYHIIIKSSILFLPAINRRSLKINPVIKMS